MNNKQNSLRSDKYKPEEPFIIDTVIVDNTLKYDSMPFVVEKKWCAFPEIVRAGAPRLRGDQFMVKATIDSKGRVKDVRMLTSEFKAFDSSILCSLLQWQFSPARMKNAPVEIQVILIGFIP